MLGNYLFELVVAYAADFPEVIYTSNGETTNSESAGMMRDWIQSINQLIFIPKCTALPERYNQ